MKKYILAALVLVSTSAMADTLIIGVNTFKTESKSEACLSARDDVIKSASDKDGFISGYKNGNSFSNFHGCDCHYNTGNDATWICSVAAFYAHKR
jgi:hypothetical protein